MIPVCTDRKAEFFTEVETVLADFSSSQWETISSKHLAASGLGMMTPDLLGRRTSAVVAQQSDHDLRPGISTFNAMIFAYCSDGTRVVLLVISCLFPHASVPSLFIQDTSTKLGVC